jgi:hypothetical protein
VVKLAPERKHLTNLIKMVAYQAESDLLRLVAPHYRRAGDEGRTLIQSALASAADLQVTQTELRVTWRRKVRRTARGPSRRFARNSTKRKPSFQAPDCACTTRFGRHLEAKSGHFA